jgi:glucose/arabinose dehydrogenase
LLHHFTPPRLRLARPVARLLVGLMLAGLLLPLGAAAPLQAAPGDLQVTSVRPLEVVASGLIKPRGLTFGPDGTLYVAEAGNGGSQLVDLGWIRPHAIGRSGRLTRVGPDGSQSTLADGLPAIITATLAPVGPAAVAVLEGQLYLLTASGGWEFGDPEFHNGVFRVDPDGTLHRILDYSAYMLEHPTRSRLEDPRADVPLGMPYGLTALGGRLYATDANQEQVLAITPSGEATRLVEYPLSNRALTGLAAGPDGALYVAEFAASTLTRVSLEGELADVVTGLPVPIGVAFDPAGLAYVLEYKAGRVVRGPLDDPAHWETLADGLPDPTALTIGPNGDLYISLGGGKKDSLFAGQVVRMSLPAAPGS